MTNVKNVKLTVSPTVGSQGMLISDSSGEYMTEDVDHIFKKYFKLLNIRAIFFWKSDLPIVSIRAIFLLAINDYFNKIITIDDLATISDMLYYSGGSGRKMKWSSNDIFTMDRNLGLGLEIASELAYSNWKKNKDLEQELDKIKQYYQKNKFVIESLI